MINFEAFGEELEHIFLEKAAGISGAAPSIRTAPGTGSMFSGIARRFFKKGPQDIKAARAKAQSMQAVLDHAGKAKMSGMGGGASLFKHTNRVGALKKALPNAPRDMIARRAGGQLRTTKVFNPAAGPVRTNIPGGI